MGARMEEKCKDECEDKLYVSSRSRCLDSSVGLMAATSLTLDDCCYNYSLGWTVPPILAVFRTLFA